MKFYLAGQQTFGNRGCEALVRSISGIVREQIPDATFLIPSFDPARDGAQWPGMQSAGCALVPGVERSPRIKWWNRVVSRIPALMGAWEPWYTPSSRVKSDFAQCQGALMIGGDVISLDYGPGSLFLWSGLMDAAHRAGLPTMLFAASVGPFSANTVVERYMRKHLQRYSAISVRETASLKYLQGLGLQNAVLVADPAFRLEPEKTELGPPFDQASDGVLAFNISPLVQNGWQSANPGKELLDECAAFLQRVMAETSLSVLLLPHVDPLDGSSGNSDSYYMSGLLSKLGGASKRLALLRPGLNAAQLKHVVGSCRFLIAARTHATVAGWSQHVPTISIAYSVKARGLNQDLFGHLDYVLETPKVGRNSLWQSYQLLVERESFLRDHLAKQIPSWKVKAGESAQLLKGVLQ
jgi:colanic acid/amylovoran biosynthesis protein